MFNLFKQFDLFKIEYSGNTYNPLINYDWSTTTTSGLRYLKDVGSTPTYNASMYFGRGVYLNGVDQYINSKTFGELGIAGECGAVSFGVNVSGFISKVILNTGFASGYAGVSLLVSDNELKILANTAENVLLTTPYQDGNVVCVYENKTWSIYVNGILKASRLFTYSKPFTFSSPQVVSIGAYRASAQYGKGNIKDVYMFTKALTQSEITQAYEQPESFYAMAQADSTCVLNMPMCETSSTVRNYKTGINYPISNYTTSVRDNAKNLQYGLQTCKFVRDSAGIIQSASDYLECNGTGYAIIPSHTDTVNIKMTVNPTSLSGNLLSGGVTKTLTGLTLNVDNNVVISNVTPTGAITLASGFSGTIKTYTEELV